MPVQPSASVPVTVTVELPAVVGVPERTPAELNVKPNGKVPVVTANVYGAVPPLALRGVLFVTLLPKTFVTPNGKLDGETVIVGQFIVRL